MRPAGIALLLLCALAVCGCQHDLKRLAAGPPPTAEDSAFASARNPVTFFAEFAEPHDCVLQKPGVGLPERIRIRGPRPFPRPVRD